VNKALDYAVRYVPREKLLLGLPFYGREWIETGDEITTRNLAYLDARTLLDRPEIRSQWDQRWRSPWFRYRDGSTLRTVWFEDRRSLKEKLQLMVEYRLRGFAAWRLGSEDPEFWPLAAAVGKTPVGGSSDRSQKPYTRQSRRPKGNAVNHLRLRGR